MINYDEDLIILECTVRDGNYAVNFKFTESDTTLLTGQLAKLGFKWIEVGHGLGLGGMEAGKGDMTAKDVDFIKAARMTCGDAKIGMFFIPEISPIDYLEIASDAGLDFVRIGNNAPYAEKAYPAISRARKLGMIPCLNMMKSYAVTPKEFAVKAKGAVDAGVEIVYLVDSAGCMFPKDIAEYFDETRKVVNCKLGFHGHNNLMMVIANCITAYEHGVRYLDATLCGLGRSAGNAPTEILIAVFERMGISTGIDLFELMDTVEMYMWPLVAQIRPNDMMGVTAGYSQFHSSFLPKVSNVARKYNVELRRLVAKVAFKDPVHIDDDFLESAAFELADTNNPRPSMALLSFNVPAISYDRIDSSLKSVQALIDGLVVSSAKNIGTRTILQLEPSKEPMEDLLIPEFILNDENMVMGRVTYGSLEILRKVVTLARTNIFMFIVNLEDNWAEHALKIVSEIVGEEKTVSVHDEEIRKIFLIETVDRIGQRFGNETILIYGLNVLVNNTLNIGFNFNKKFLFVPNNFPYKQKKDIIVLNTLNDWRNLNLKFDVILCSTNPSKADSSVLSHVLTSMGKIITISPRLNFELHEVFADSLIKLDLNIAYSGMLTRILTTESSLGMNNLEESI